MEAESSLLCSQQPATGPYLEPDESRVQLPTLFPKINSNIILPLMRRFSNQTLYTCHISPMHITSLHACLSHPP